MLWNGFKILNEKVVRFCLSYLRSLTCTFEIEIFGYNKWLKYLIAISWYGTKENYFICWLRSTLARVRCQDTWDLHQMSFDYVINDFFKQCSSHVFHWEFLHKFYHWKLQSLCCKQECHCQKLAWTGIFANNRRTYISNFLCECFKRMKIRRTLFERTRGNSIENKGNDFKSDSSKLKSFSKAKLQN